jgi:hypothetical protein
MSDEEIISTLNYDVLELDKLETNPYCSHGPTVLFTNGRKKYFSCSACRDNKNCSFYYEYNENKKIPMEKLKFWHEIYKKENDRISSANIYW